MVVYWKATKRDSNDVCVCVCVCVKEHMCNTCGTPNRTGSTGEVATTVGSRVKKGNSEVLAALTYFLSCVIHTCFSFRQQDPPPPPHKPSFPFSPSLAEDHVTAVTFSERRRKENLDTSSDTCHVSVCLRFLFLSEKSGGIKDTGPCKGKGGGGRGD